MWRILSLTRDEAVENELDALDAAGGGFYSVEHATQTKEVIAWTSANRYDVYVLDISLENTTALGLCSLVRSWDADSVIIVLSRDKSERDHALHAGADLFLLRPSETHRLRQIIEGLLEKDKTGGTGSVAQALGKPGEDVEKQNHK